MWKTYCEHHKIAFAEPIDWEQEDKAVASALEDAINALPQAEYEPIHAHLERINVVASERGIKALINASDKPDEMTTKLEAMENSHHRAMAILSGKKLGHAAVIPSHWIVPTPAPLREIPFGVFGRASDCVTGDDESAHLARQLLCDVLIVESLEAALRLRSDNPSFAFASLDGGFITHAGIIHGGQSGENAGQSTLQRKIRIAELESSLADATSRIESLAA
ncbi:MAG: hypothetical protein EB015_21730, partial [Methylocystaceae bacterium]|nr:hypothetical protein [Methylocystaceae bacterium]